MCSLYVHAILTHGRVGRPEFVQRYDTALCSDGMTAFCDVEPDHGRASNAAIFEATKALLHRQVPAFVTVVLPTITTAHDLVDKLHSEGINVRWLGRVWALLPYRGHDSATQRQKAVVFCEMAARCFKGIVEFNWLQQGGASIDMHKCTTGVLVNLLVGDTATPGPAQRFWAEALLPLMRLKFVGFEWHAPTSPSASPIPDWVRSLIDLVREPLWRRALVVLGVQIAAPPPLSSAAQVRINARVAFPSLPNAPVSLDDAVVTLEREVQRRCPAADVEALPVDAVPDALSLAEMYRLSGNYAAAEVWLQRCISVCISAVDASDGGMDAMTSVATSTPVRQRLHGIAFLQLGLAFQGLRAVYEVQSQRGEGEAHDSHSTVSGAGVGDAASASAEERERAAAVSAYKYLSRLLERDTATAEPRDPTLDEVMQRVDMSAAHKREVVGVLVDTLDFLVAYNRNRRTSWVGSEGKVAIARLVCTFALEQGVRLDQMWRMLSRLAKKLTEDSQFAESFRMTQVCACCTWGASVAETPRTC